MNNLKIKSDKIISYFGDTTKVPLEIFIQDLGWIIILREEVENVTDNWFTSSKYNASTIEEVDGEGQVLKLTNVYKANASFVDNEKNLKYNLTFDEIYISTDKVVAYF